MEMIICKKLMELNKEKRIPFHMPGHKRKLSAQDIIQMDITEIRGYDNLHHPEGMILESMEQLKEFYGTQKSWYLINGSTVGILASVSAVCQPGDEIIMARNCHKSVYNAARLLHLNPVYLYPEYSEEYDMFLDIREKQKEEIKILLEKHSKIKAVVITSPTYEGVVSDVAGIKEILAPYGIPLIVDEAHGAHFAFSGDFPESAVSCGADLVIQSIHKTLPCVTQTALLHLCSELVPAHRIEEMLSIYETSSPSYLLLASAEYGICYTQEHPDRMQEYVDNLKKFRRKCAKLKHISLFTPEENQVYDYDIGKLVFLTKSSNLSGAELFRFLLDRFHIECEMETAFYCIAMTSINDTAESFERLEEAIFAIDEELECVPRMDTEDPETTKGVLFSQKPVQCRPVWEVKNGEKKRIPLEESMDEIAADYIYLYPPGIPVLVPGEKITKEIVANIKYYLYNGYNVPALSEGTIEVSCSGDPLEES